VTKHTYNAQLSCQHQTWLYHLELVLLTSQSPETETLPHQLEVVRIILDRIAQSEHPADFWILKQLLLERVAQLKDESDKMPPAKPWRIEHQ
jgi:hypothetical protein